VAGRFQSGLLKETAMPSLEVLFGVGIVLVLAALIWAMIQYRSRNRANDPVTDKAAKTMFDDPDTYDAKRADLQSQVRPPD
jgi:hypothetical protein